MTNGGRSQRHERPPFSAGRWCVSRTPARTGGSHDRTPSAAGRGRRLPTGVRKDWSPSAPMPATRIPSAEVGIDDRLTRAGSDDRDQDRSAGRPGHERRRSRACAGHRLRDRHRPPSHFRRLLLRQPLSSPTLAPVTATITFGVAGTFTATVTGTATLSTTVAPVATPRPAASAHRGRSQRALGIFREPGETGPKISTSGR